VQPNEWKRAQDLEQVMRRSEHSEQRIWQVYFCPMREKVIRGWKTLHKEKLHNLYFSKNIKAIKSRRMAGWIT
jgi:hypothetical protein